MILAIFNFFKSWSQNHHFRNWTLQFQSIQSLRKQIGDIENSLLTFTFTFRHRPMWTLIDPLEKKELKRVAYYEKQGHFHSHSRLTRE